MNLLFDKTTGYENCKKYLESQIIPYKVYKIADYWFIKILDGSIEERIEKDGIKFEGIKDISLENGYLVTKQYKNKTLIKIGNVEIGGIKPIFISGPCSIESKHTLHEIAYKVREAGCNILRGGAFKPRSSPYDFQGLGKDGIEVLYEVKKELNIPIITEVMDVRDIDYLLDKVDILQIGSRNMQNFELLKEVGKTRKPILLKRGLASTIKETLLSAEYIMFNGNEQIILCERGIRTYEHYTRNTMDISAVSVLKEISHLPVIADPSHATGIRTLIKPMTYAAIAAGADGIMIESHISPECAWSDGKQSIYPEQLRDIIHTSLNIKKVLNA